MDVMVDVHLKENVCRRNLSEHAGVLQEELSMTPCLPISHRGRSGLLCFGNLASMCGVGNSLDEIIWISAVEDKESETYPTPNNQRLSRN